MTRTQRMLCRFALVLITGIAARMIFALSAVAQTPSGASGKATPPPVGWMEKWVGMYAAQDREGKIAPPGYKVLLPPEPDTLELALALAQPWARMRHDATDYELEDTGQICRPTGPLRGNQTSDFQLVASPEKITILGGTGGGILTGGIRRIYMNRPHLKNPPLTYLGDWVGHWDGDTLVMDGIGFHEKTWLTRDRARHSEALHIVERWRFLASGEWLEKTITVDDRFALTRPYTVTRYHKKLPTSTPIPERLCIDTPEGRRAWVKIYKRALKEWEENGRTILELEANKTGRK